jgi:flagellar hook assembly protein FlgD
MNISGADALNFLSNITGKQQTKSDKTGLEQHDPTATTKKPKKDVDANTFMTLLVAQLKHQDPLEPQDGTQFVAQLAQFNSLEQLININKRLDEMIKNSGQI